MGEDAIGVAVALEALRGEVRTGFATVNGRLDLALQRTDTVERDLAATAVDMEALEGRIATLERKIWLAAGFAAALGAGGGAGLWQILGS